MDADIDAYDKMDKKLTGQDKRIAELLSKQERVKLAYLFGSVAERKEGKQTDLAVFLDVSQGMKERLNLQMYRQRKD